MNRAAMKRRCGDRKGERMLDDGMNFLFNDVHALSFFFFFAVISVAEQFGK